MKAYRMLICFCLLSATVSAEQAPAPADAKAASETALTNGQAAPQNPTDNSAQAANATAPSKTTTETSLKNAAPIADPTQMTGSFSQALNRINGKPGQPGASGRNTPLPEITVVAKAICKHKKNSAMLNVAGETRMIRTGGKFSFIDGNQLYEVHIDKIENDQVAITLLPMNRQIILQ